MSKQLSLSLKTINVEEKSVEMKSVCDRILFLAKQKGASSAEVGVSHDFGINVQARNNDVETVEFNQDNSFGISVFFGQSKGSATTTDTSEEAIVEAVNAACNIAKYTSADPFSGLADPKRMATNLIDLQLDHPCDLTTDDMIDMAKRCEAAGLSANPLIKQSDSVNVSSHRSIRVYANSHGFCGETSSTRYSTSCVLIAEDAKGMQRDYWFSVGREFNTLEDVEVIGKKAAERTVSRLGAKTISTRKTPILMASDVARSIVGHFLGGIQGGAIYRKSSFLLDSVGQPIFPSYISIDERPRLLKGLASTCFDNEGVATQDRVWVDKGEVQGYVLGSYSARKLGLETTGNAGGLHNVFVNHSDNDFDMMLKELNTGLFVTEIMGQGVNMVTGDYSRGAAGFWVENGEIQFPVHEVTIAGNLKDMFQNIRCIGSDIDERSMIKIGSMIIDGLTIAGS